jgi:hypothetical protein
MPALVASGLLLVVVASELLPIVVVSSEPVTAAPVRRLQCGSDA